MKLAITLSKKLLLVSIIAVAACAPRADKYEGSQPGPEYPSIPPMDNPVPGVTPDVAAETPTGVTQQSMPSEVVQSSQSTSTQVEEPLPPAATKFLFSGKRVGEFEKGLNPLEVFLPKNQLGGMDPRLKSDMNEELQVYYRYRSGVVSRQILKRGIEQFDTTRPDLTADSVQIVNRLEVALDQTALPGYVEQQFRCDEVTRNAAQKIVTCQKVREFNYEEEAQKQISRQLGITTESYKTCWMRNAESEVLNRDTGTYKLLSGQKIEKVEVKIVQEKGEVMCGTPEQFEFIGEGVRSVETVLSYEQPTLEFLDASTPKIISRFEEIQIKDDAGRYELVQQSRVEVVEMSQIETSK